MIAELNFHKIITSFILLFIVAISVLAVIGMGSLHVSQSSVSVLGHSDDLLDKIVSGEVFIRSTGVETLQIQATSDINNSYSEYLLKNPNGVQVDRVTKTQAELGFDQTYILSLPGDYHFIPTLSSRAYSLVSTARMVLVPNKYAPTFYGLEEGHSASRLYFQVPTGTSEVTVNGILFSGDDTPGNEMIVYDNTGAIHSTVSLTYPTSGNYVTDSVSIPNPTPGYWSVSMNIGTTSGSSTGTFWVEGVNNIFAYSQAELFTPQMIKGSVDVDIQLSTSQGQIPQIGAGPIYIDSEPSQQIQDAATQIGIQTTTLKLDHSQIESVNDDSDPSNLNISGFDFSSSGIQFLVENLNIDPTIIATNPATWLTSTLSYSCDGGPECNLQDSSTWSEWSEFILAIANYLNITSSYQINQIVVAPSVNRLIIPFSDFGMLYESASSKLSAQSESQINQLLLPFGDFIVGDSDDRSYLSNSIFEVSGASYDSIALQIYDLGVTGIGSIYSDRYQSDLIDTVVTQSNSQGGVTPNSISLLGINSSQLGKDIHQDYYDSVEHSLWWASNLVSLISNSNISTINYFPFIDSDVTTAGGMILPDGTVKSVGRVTEYFIDALSTTDSVYAPVISGTSEVTGVTVSDDTTHTLILINKEDRVQGTTATIQIPSESDVTWEINKYSAQNTTGLQLQDSGTTQQFSGELTIAFDMSEESIYFLTIQQSEYVCTPNWQCTDWGTCTSGGTQDRSCTDLNSCGDNSTKPDEQKVCNCIPDWSCSAYSECVDKGQSRSCVDNNQCDDDSDRPTEFRQCEVECTPNWQCEQWSVCGASGFQYRNCINLNSCESTSIIPPDLRQTCDPECIPNWECGEWTQCSNSEQSRECVDTNQCGNEQSTPELTQSCIESESQSDQLSLDPKLLIGIIVGLMVLGAGTVGFVIRSRSPKSIISTQSE